MRRLWDISPKVSLHSPVFPGDTPFQVLWNERINDGGVANISTIHMSAHVGAHVDAPMHLDSGAVDVSVLRLERFIGRCRVIDLSDSDRTDPMTEDELASGCYAERVLVKTRKVLPKTWTDDFRPIEPAAVRMLRESGVVLIGLDTPSIDPADSVLLPSHRVALQAGISLIENLDLTEVEAGEYELIALPLKLEGVEASPVRAILRTLPHH